jgi:hypothetical protein
MNMDHRRKNNWLLYTPEHTPSPGGPMAHRQHGRPDPQLWRRCNTGSTKRLLIIGLVAFGTLAASVASAAPQISVKVTLERIFNYDDFEGGGEEDFYACVNIAGVERCNEDTPEQEQWEDNEDITPNWEFSNREVDAASGTVSLEIEIRDEDGLFRLDDDHMDVNPASGRNLFLAIDLATCNISGSVTGNCDQTIIAQGSEEDAGELHFHVEVGAKPSAPDLNIKCVHSPTSPKPNEPITITATVLDGALGSKTADKIEIFANSKESPVATIAGAGTLSTMLSAAGGAPQIFYGCRGFSGSEEVWSGWRVVGIQQPAIIATGIPLPVIITGDASSRLDFMFFPDTDFYTGAADPDFLADVATIINAYYSEPNYLAHQDQINFWIANEVALAEDSAEGCDHEMPSGWFPAERGELATPSPFPTVYAFVDAAAIVHRRDPDAFRDCAPGGDRIFSATVLDTSIHLHESGHRPFGLADEYCCDGGYFMSDPYPNVYEEPDECADDLFDLKAWDVKLGRPERNTCREFEETVENWDDFDWSISEPASNDLMQDKGSAQGADVRRMEWLYGECTRAGC